MATTNYKKITELTPLNGQLLANDMVLMARRDVTDVGYTTYQTYVSTLSSSIINNVKEMTLSISLLTSLNQLDPTCVTSAMAGNIGYYLSSAIQTLQTRNSQLTLSVNNIYSQINNLSTNLPSIIRTYSDQLKISNNTPTTWIYHVKSSTASEPISMDDYYKQGIETVSSNRIMIDRRQFANCPLVHIVTKDSTVVIHSISYSSKSTTNFGYKLFVNYNINTVTSGTKEFIQNNQNSETLNSSWVYIGQCISPLESLTINCKKNTCLCFYQYYNITDGKEDIIPKYNSTLTNSSGLKILEY